MEKIALTPMETAKTLQISQMTVYRLAQKGDLPGRKVGRSWRFSRLALENWLNNAFWGHRLENLTEKIWQRTEKIPAPKIQKEINSALAEAKNQ